MEPFRPSSDDALLPVEEAQQRVIQAVRLLESEQVALTAAFGRVLREDIRASRDVPARDNSAMDGYAVIAEDVIEASADKPVLLRVIEDLPAGTVATRIVERGTAARIMTGALVPSGADAVVPVELTDGGGSVVSVMRGVGAGVNIRKRGEDMVRESIILRAGSVIGAAEAGVLATAQKSLVSVARRPAVAIFSTGDEVVGIDAQLSDAMVVNSNSYSLAGLAMEAGAVPRMMGVVDDSKQATIEAIEAALEADIVISSGGVSVGAYDFVKAALESLGAETSFWRIAMKPGKPLVFSQLREKLYFGLPGNPVSCMVSFLLFVGPAIRTAMGMKDDVFPPVVDVRSDGILRSNGDRRAYQRVRVVARNGELVALPMVAQGSGVSTSMVKANGLAILEVGVRQVGIGDRVSVVLFGPVQAG